MKTLIVIVGPTGVGKTALCLEVAERLGTFIINADSRQIFRDIPIGTAAPTAEEQKRVKHFFVGKLHINDYYNASMFENDVIKLLDKLFGEKDNIIMSGGSMMYVDAVCNGIDDIPSVNENIRQQVKSLYEADGLDIIKEKLKKLDPEYFEIVDKNNPKRVIHALEICLSTGKTYTSFRTNTKKERNFRIIKIGLNRDRDELYSRIDKRVDLMIENGLMEEAKRMYPHKELNSLNTVGYKELFNYFDGNCTLDEAIFKIKSNTHKYCRKQLTWFKRDKDIHWFNPDNVEEIIKYIYSFS
jgi:tRNA dimethylallyltransferase